MFHRRQRGRTFGGGGGLADHVLVLLVQPLSGPVVVGRHGDARNQLLNLRQFLFAPLERFWSASWARESPLWARFVVLQRACCHFGSATDDMTRQGARFTAFQKEVKRARDFDDNQIAGRISLALPSPRRCP